MAKHNMRYFELSEGKAHKFWQLELSDEAYTVTLLQKMSLSPGHLVNFLQDPWTP